jgi:hypothetical protein
VQPEPAERQILQQLLGHERGADVFALYTLAASCAQMSQQVQQQADLIQQLQAPPAEAAPTLPFSENPWTGPDVAVNGTAELVGAIPTPEAP